MLSYINCYRDQSSHDCIRKVVLSFYSATEISDAKRHLLEAFDEQLLDCQLRADRRNSSSRPAHEAEVDDIFGILTFLDNSSLLKDFLFVAVNHEVNICTVVDRQVRLDAKFDFLAARLEVSGSVPILWQMMLSLASRHLYSSQQGLLAIRLVCLVLNLTAGLHLERHLSRYTVSPVLFILVMIDFGMSLLVELLKTATMLCGEHRWIMLSS